MICYQKSDVQRSRYTNDQANTTRCKHGVFKPLFSGQQRHGHLAVRAPARGRAGRERENRVLTSQKFLKRWISYK